MKLLSTIFLCSSPFLLSQKIEWSSMKKLEWSNFKKLHSSHSSKKVIAYTNCGLQYTATTSSNPKKEALIEIIAIFNEDKSWKDEKRISEYVLNHEQKHFDICELYARKLRKLVSEKIKTTEDFNKSFNNIYKKILVDYQNFQLLYDKETAHGINDEAQEKYNQEISKQLDELKTYQRP